MPVELKERFDKLTFIRESESGPDGKTVYKFSGPFQEMSDVVNRKNKNGRRYTKALWERVLKDPELQEKLKTRRMLGELDHPSEEGQIRRTSHIVTEITPNIEEGLVYGKLELLNHNQGDAALVRALVDQGVQLCVSSRGYGEFLEDGCTIDPESYKLQTWDIVLDPSVSIAKVNKVAEAINESLAPESRIRILAEGQVGERKPLTEINNHKQGDTRMDEKLLAAINEAAALKTEAAVAKNTIQHLTEKITEKNEVIAALQKENQALKANVTEQETEGNEAADMLLNISEENKSLKAKVSETTKELAEYNDIEDKAVKVIEELKAKCEEYEALGEKAADTIESLMSKIKGRRSKKNEDGSENQPSKKDTSKGASNPEVGEEAGEGEESSSKDEADGVSGMGASSTDVKPVGEEGEEGEEGGESSGAETPAEERVAMPTPTNKGKKGEGVVNEDVMKILETRGLNLPAKKAEKK